MIEEFRRRGLRQLNTKYIYGKFVRLLMFLLLMARDGNGRVEEEMEIYWLRLI